MYTQKRTTIICTRQTKTNTKETIYITKRCICIQQNSASSGIEDDRYKRDIYIHKRDLPIKNTKETYEYTKETCV